MMNSNSNSVKSHKPANERVLLLHAGADLYGAGKSLSVVANTYKKAGIHVVVVLPYTGPLSERLQKAAVDVRIINLGIIRRKYLTPWGLINRFLVSVSAIRALKKIAREEKITVIHSNTLAVLVGGIVSRRFGIPHVWHIREVMAKSGVQKKFLDYFMKKYGTLAISVSEEVKKSWGTKDFPIKVIYNGVKAEDYQFSGKNTIREELNIAENKIVVGMIARVHYWKGQQYFLDIAKSLMNHNDQLHFIMVGDAYPGYEFLYKEIEKKIDANGLRDNVSVLGFRPDVPAILQVFDVSILPSVQADPLPNTVLEAMASGTPVAATAHGGAVEMVDDGNTGVLIPWDDAKTAAELIEPLIQNVDLRLEMGKKANARVRERFSVEQFEKQMLQVISTIRS